MPCLENPRHERFIRAFVRSGVGQKAYCEAYGVAPGPAADTSAWRLLGCEQVQRRKAELERAAAGRNDVTTDSLVQELDEARNLAAQLQQPAAMVSSIIAKARVTGNLVQKRETGKAGSFESLASITEVVERVRAELGDQAAEDIASFASARDRASR